MDRYQWRKANLAAWDEYMRKNRAANLSYRAMPTAFHHAGPTCSTCHQRTNNIRGLCTACRKKAKTKRAAREGP